jgi:chemotaxis methyl-accepting protein methylase
MDSAWPGKYFKQVTGDKQGLKYQIADNLKTMVSFKQQNFITEEPLKGMDIIFCRNALIYVTAETKIFLIEKFYNSLVPDGLFVTGKSELVFMGKGRYNFNVISNNEHIYQKRG